MQKYWYFGNYCIVFLWELNIVELGMTISYYSHYKEICLRFWFSLSISHYSQKGGNNE